MEVKMLMASSMLQGKLGAAECRIPLSAGELSSRRLVSCQRRSESSFCSRLSVRACSRENGVVKLEEERSHFMNQAPRVLGAVAIFLASGVGFLKVAKAEENLNVNPLPAEVREGLFKPAPGPNANPVRRTKVSSRARLAKEKEEKLKAALKKLEEEPESESAHRDLLELYMQSGDVKEAIQVLDKLITLLPDRLDLQYMRARAYDMAGNVRKARKEFEQLAKAQPFSAKVLQGLVFAMHKTGERHEKILQLVERAIQHAVKENQAVAARDLKMLLGQVLTVQKKITEALAQYEEIIKEDPDDFRPYLCQGLLYTSIGKTEDAARCLRTYRKLCPKTFSKRRYLDELLLRGKLGLEQKQEEKQGKRVATMQQPKVR